MAQLTIYLDSETLRKIESAAAESSVSISKWVREKIEIALRDEWPESFSRIFGALRETDLVEPGELDFRIDVSRGQL
ncbi:MAG: toxin-antitoxin system, antitoxin component [Spirochaetia bacterium]|jgi:hypothetical protein